MLNLRVNEKDAKQLMSLCEMYVSDNEGIAGLEAHVADCLRLHDEIQEQVRHPREAERKWQDKRGPTSGREEA
jgi:hypothetical protein